METSDDEEDGQITKYDEEEERDRKLYGKSNPDDEPVSLEDLNKCRIGRNQIAKHCMAPWFEDYVKGKRAQSLTYIRRINVIPGAWVRYLIGQENNQPVYRICEVVGRCLHSRYRRTCSAVPRHRSEPGQAIQGERPDRQPGTRAEAWGVNAPIRNGQGVQCSI